MLDCFKLGLSLEVAQAVRSDDLIEQTDLARHDLRDAVVGRGGQDEPAVLGVLFA